MKTRLTLLSIIMAFTMSFAQTTKVDETLKKVSEETTKITETSKKGISAVYSDSKGAISTVYGDLKSLAPDAKEAMKEIVSTLKQTSNSVWDILVKQQKVWSWCYLIGGIFAGIAWCHFYWRFKKYSAMNYNVEDKEHLPWSWSQLLISGFLFVTATILSVIFANNLVDMMTGFINPEFGAIKNIIQIASRVNQ